MQQLNKFPERHDVLSGDFLRAMRAAKSIFQLDAFRKRYRKEDKRQPVSKTLFEIWSVNLSLLDDQQLALLRERREKLMDGFIRLMSDRTFDNAISQGTGDKKKVSYRFQAIANLIQEVLA